MYTVYIYTYTCTYIHIHIHIQIHIQFADYSLQYTVYTRILYMYAIVYIYTHLHIHCLSDELRLGVTASILSVIKDIVCALTAVVLRADQLRPREVQY